ncbi:MAG: hypothetical protein O2825_04100 [Proteobacteria bacterium]|nr:hypothetical protein [Pseudomonadota bacterium]
MRLKLCVLALAAWLAATGVRAEWPAVSWGMSYGEAVALLGGTPLIPPDVENEGWPEGVTVLGAPSLEGGLVGDVLLVFVDDWLVSMQMKPPSPDAAACEAFVARVLEVWGEPVEATDSGDGLSWSRFDPPSIEDEAELIVAHRNDRTICWAGRTQPDTASDVPAGQLASSQRVMEMMGHLSALFFGFEP